MPEYMINGIAVNFPFEPYDVQKDYMSKVIECLENGTNAVLESPTGTGKTLSLLCSTLSWILSKKAQNKSVVSDNQVLAQLNQNYSFNPSKNNIPISENPNSNGENSKNLWNIPKIIYSTRTHSQLTQAVQELKRTHYNFVKAVVLGSRDQLCIHPDVSKEQNNSTKIQLCKLNILAKSCSFYHRVESKKDSPEFRMQTVMDIEDLVTIGSKLKMCPYFGSKELVQDADITFMPYNYLLDPKARRANKVELANTIVILDEAHNVEKICEDSISVQIKSSDIALCIDDLTQIMKSMTEDSSILSGDEPKDFTIEDLALLKEMFLELEKAVDEIVVVNKIDGTTFSGEYIFELLAKANITFKTEGMINRLLESLIQFLAMASQNNTVFRKGSGLQIVSDLLTIVFSGSEQEDQSKIIRSFKVHVQIEEIKQQKNTTVKDGWMTSGTSSTSTKMAKIINYWCFNPGFGMEQLLNKNVRSVILTSGTLAPLKPLIAELSIPISVRLENPHIVGKSQVCVKIVGNGPDREILNSNFKNRDNPKYVNSLGRTILSFCPVIPDGLLVFFPSYPLMNKCIDSWQASGIWSQINRHKQVFVEPRSKDAFQTTMNNFYSDIHDPTKKGACFMAVCRGKVSEGLDFADINGRAVIITGLPYPPLKDPRVILKRRYLDENRTRENELLSGENWYSLEATRAVNQAIGRVIRHKNDYGAILLCDTRFNYPSQKSQLSSWIQGHLNTSQQNQSFGPLIGEVSRFFRNAEKTIPKPPIRIWKPETPMSTELTKSQSFSKIQNRNQFTNKKEIKIENSNEAIGWKPENYSSAISETANQLNNVSNTNFSAINFNDMTNSIMLGSNSLVGIHKRERPSSSIDNQLKKRKFKLVSNTISTPSVCNNGNSSSTSIFTSNLQSTSDDESSQESSVPKDRVELLKLIKCSISTYLYGIFVKALMAYQKNDNFEEFFQSLLIVFEHENHRYLLKSMQRYVKKKHSNQFDEYLVKEFK